MDWCWGVPSLDPMGDFKSGSFGALLLGCNSQSLQQRDWGRGGQGAFSAQHLLGKAAIPGLNSVSLRLPSDLAGGQQFCPHLPAHTHSCCIPLFSLCSHTRNFETQGPHPGL